MLRGRGRPGSASSPRPVDARGRCGKRPGHADRVAAAFGDGDALRARGRGRRGRCDLRVRLATGGADPPHCVDQCPAGGAWGGRDRRGRSDADGGRRGSLPPGRGGLAALDVDLVVTQDLCAVCAVDVSVVDDALAHLGCSGEVLTLDPQDLGEVLASVATLGAAVGCTGEASVAAAGSPGAAGRGPRCGRRAAPGVRRSPRVDRSARTTWEAVAANASFARPGPRLVDGVEMLAAVLHPAGRPAGPSGGLTPGSGRQPPTNGGDGLSEFSSGTSRS